MFWSICFAAILIAPLAAISSTANIRIAEIGKSIINGRLNFQQTTKRQNKSSGSTFAFTPSKETLQF